MHEKATERLVKTLRKGDRESHGETQLDPDDMAIPTETQTPYESWSRVLSWLLRLPDAGSVSVLVCGWNHQAMSS
jgi:hypothetical protein